MKITPPKQDITFILMIIAILTFNSCSRTIIATSPTPRTNDVWIGKENKDKSEKVKVISVKKDIVTYDSCEVLRTSPVNIFVKKHDRYSVNGYKVALCRHCKPVKN